MCMKIVLIGFISNELKRTKRVIWIRNGNIAGVEKFKYDNKPSKEFPRGKITFEATLDEITYKKYEASFLERKETVYKSEKGKFILNGRCL